MTPNKLDRLTALTEERAASFDAYIINRIVRRLMAYINAQPGEPLALVPSSINDIHRLIQRGMIAEEVQIAVAAQLPKLQSEINTAFLEAADEIAKDYIADSIMKTTDTLAEGVKEATGLDLDDIKLQVHKERVEDGTEPPEIIEEVKKEIEVKRQEARRRAPQGPNRPDIPEMDQFTEEPVKAPEKAQDEEPDYDYPDFVETCGYGQMLGICGINCRHTFSAFRPGINIDRPSNIDYEKNEERYKLTQKQRAMERKIRECERMLAALKAMDNGSDEIKEKIAELTTKRKELGAEYAKFTRENNLVSENWRFAIPRVSDTPIAGPGVLSREVLNPTLLEELDEKYRRTNAEVRNLCRTTAPSTEQAFIDACDNAFIKSRGGISMNTVIMEAVTEVAQQGVTVVNYNSGRSDRIEVAIARAVRTGINQSNAAIVLGTCKEQGINYVKASEHMGARVTKKNDFTNHAWWQGQVYKLDWNKKELMKYN